MYYAPGLVVGICTGSGPIYVVLAQEQIPGFALGTQRREAVGNPPGLGRRPDWCALEKIG